MMVLDLTEVPRASSNALTDVVTRGSTGIAKHADWDEPGSVSIVDVANSQLSLLHTQWLHGSPTKRVRIQPGPTRQRRHELGRLRARARHGMRAAFALSGSFTASRLHGDFEKCSQKGV